MYGGRFISFNNQERAGDMISLRFAVTIGASLSVLGCDNSINVRGEWGTNIAQFGLRPVYPLEQNRYPGDILLFVDNPCTNFEISPVPQTMLIGRLPPSEIHRAFAEFYGERPQFPVTPPKRAQPAAPDPAKKPKQTPINQLTVKMSAGGTNSVTATNGPEAIKDASSGSGEGGPTPQDAPAADEKNPIFPDHASFVRLPMAALPAINLFSYVGGTAGGMWSGISAAFAGQQSKSIKVDAEQIEVAELPAAGFVEMVANFKSSTAHQRMLTNLSLLKYTLELELLGAPGCRSNGGADWVKLIYVNTVYYTRNLVFNYGEDSSFAGKVAASFQGPAAALPATTFQPNTLPSAASGNPAQASAQSLLASLATMSGGPGAGGTLAIGTSGNLALNQTFARPMAFALQHQIEECVPTSKSSKTCPVTPTQIPAIYLDNQ